MIFEKVESPLIIQHFTESIIVAVYYDGLVRFAKEVVARADQLITKHGCILLLVAEYNIFDHFTCMIVIVDSDVKLLHSQAVVTTQITSLLDRKLL